MQRIVIFKPLTGVKAQKDAFTLIEMMFVVALIGILIGGMFRLLNAVGQNTQRAQTIAALQRVENALSGFYAEYGTYPPVVRCYSPDPDQETQLDQDDSTYSQLTTETEKFAWRSNRASRSQPVAFDFPSPKIMDSYVYNKFGCYSANQNLNDGTVTRFQYGLLSFLLPRIQVMGGDDLADLETKENVPEKEIFTQSQWTKYNSGNSNNKQSFKEQNAREVKTCSRWLPNLKGIITGGGTVLGVALNDSRFNKIYFSPPRETSAGNQIRLRRASVFDGWATNPDGEYNKRVIYYYSEPPYQSYRIWSAGPNGNTFPPWIPLESLSSKDRKTVSDWIADDVVRFDSK